MGKIYRADHHLADHHLGDHHQLGDHHVGENRQQFLFSSRLLGLFLGANSNSRVKIQFPHL